MSSQISLEQIDQILNELEDIADSTSGRQRFLDLIVDRLRFVLSAKSVLFALPTSSESWSVLAASGLPSSEAILDNSVLSDLIQTRPNERRIRGTEENLIIASISPETWQQGALVVKLSTAPTNTSMVDLESLVGNFAELVAINHLRHIDHFFRRDWHTFQQSVASGCKVESSDCLAIQWVNAWSSIAHASRVSIFHCESSHRARMIATNGLSSFSSKSDFVREREVYVAKSRGSEATGKAKGSESRAEAGSTSAALLPQWIGPTILLPISNGSSASDSYILFEWPDNQSYLEGCTALNVLFPIFVSHWSQVKSWLNVPRLVRPYFAASAKNGKFKSVFRMLKPILAAIILGVIIMLLRSPATVWIETDGKLQPRHQRLVFAPMDGSIVSLNVVDGQKVAEGEVIAQLHSPELQMQIEETEGRAQTLAEKRDGLNVAINQLSGDTAESLTLQAKLSSEIKEIDTEVKYLRGRLAALRKEEQTLQLVAPLAGVVVAPDAEVFLRDRPVKRGDPLLRIADDQSGWQIDLRIADADSGYVKRMLENRTGAIGGDTAGLTTHTVTYTLDSSPEVIHEAAIRKMSEVAQSDERGVFFKLEADVTNSTSSPGRLGESVKGHIECGSAEFWFVWTRPLVEAIQKQIWFQSAVK